MANNEGANIREAFFECFLKDNDQTLETALLKYEREMESTPRKPCRKISAQKHKNFVCPENGLLLLPTAQYIGAMNRESSV